MLFLARFSGKQTGRLTADLLRRHVDYLAEQTAAGRIRLCGAAADGTALFLLDCADADAAGGLVRLDPFVAETYYEAFDIAGFREANPANGFLMNEVLARLASATGESQKPFSAPEV